MRILARISLLALTTALFATTARAAEMPALKHADGRYTFVVDGQPFFPFGAQVGNSSAWPQALDDLWPKVAAMHLNTLELPVYWEQLEPSENYFDDTLLDNAVRGAREHNVRLVLLWFGTWKNGKSHYVPSWVKQDTKRFPRMMMRTGQPIDVLSPNIAANRDADAKAFTHLMHHLKEIDGEQHTVILVQVENESGALGSVRDFSPAAEKQFHEPVPATLLHAVEKKPGTWREVFGVDADEYFQAWNVASYVQAVATAGKQEMPLPMYVNNWLKSPRGFPILTVPGDDYPSGGPSANMLSVWKAAAPTIDILAPDIYVPNTNRYRSVMEQFKRPDNPLFIPETQGFGHFPGSDGNARNLFLAIGAGVIGFAPFGLDRFQPIASDGKPDMEQRSLAENYALLAPMQAEIARLQFAGAIQTAVEEPGVSQAELSFGDWSAQIDFPPSYAAGAAAPEPDGSAALHAGRVLIARLGTNEFLVAGIDARVSFRRLPVGSQVQTEFLTVEEGSYSGTTWTPHRLWNGDETDYGLNFKSPGKVLHVKLGSY